MYNRSPVTINNSDHMIYFVKYSVRGTEIITGKQARQKKAMKLLGIRIDGVYWNDDVGQLQVDMI